MKKCIGIVVCIFAMSFLFLSGCSQMNNIATDKNVADKNVADKNTADKNIADKNIADKNVTDKNVTEILQTEDKTKMEDQITENKDKASVTVSQSLIEVSSKAVKKKKDKVSHINSNFKLIIEAEDAAYTGKARVEKSKDKYSGTGYLACLESEDGSVTFTAKIPGTGAYDLNFISAANTGHKENNVLVDGENVGVVKVDGDKFTDSVIENVYLTQGKHKIQITKSWGWIYLDALKITPSKPVDKSIYKVEPGLVDDKATGRTKNLMKYMTDMYGKYIISGQYGDRGIKGNEFKAIYQATGKYPAILGLDFIDYTPSRTANGTSSMDVQYAMDFDKQGGIVTFCWHWNAPSKYLVNTKDIPWWKGFYKEGTTINLKKIMNGEDKEGYDLLLKDIDVIAFQLKRLQTADIPILWRPLHEASGGWFWWGASGPDAYNKLYRLLYDRLTNYHNIHNLIWVWNGQSKDWYPGDQYVDIVGTDIYPGKRVYNSQASSFKTLVKWNGKHKKIIAMTENGCLFDPELAFRDNAKWSYFSSWEGEFVTLNKTYTLSDEYTEADIFKKVYTSDKVITLDELPDLRTYGK